MSKTSYLIGIGFLLSTLVAVTITYQPLQANELQSLLNPASIVNTSSENALTITQTTDVGKSRSGDGALLIDNSGNRNTGLTLYSNRDDSVAQPLMRMEVTDKAWDEEILHIHSESESSRGLIRLDSPAPEIEFVETDQRGAAGKFELRVQHDTFQINSRLPDDSSFEKKITMSHEGDLDLHEGSLTVHGDTPSEFKNGINITGGCIAFEGDCLDLTNTAKSTQQPAEPAQPTSASTQLATTAGAPDPIACNSYTERGSMLLDTEQHRMYVCNGPDRGWDYYKLID